MRNKANLLRVGKCILALTKFASYLCSSSKAQILLTAVRMRSGIDEPPSFIRAEARQDGTGVHILNFLRAMLPLNDRLATPSESLRDLKDDQSGSWNSVSSKRDSLLICVGKVWEVVPERMKSLEMGIILVTPILVKWWINMMWFVIGALARKWCWVLRVPW